MHQSGSQNIVFSHLIEVNSLAFSEWNVYTDFHQIARQLETQALIAKRSALLLNSGKIHPTPEQLTTLFAHIENWNPIQNWPNYLMGIRDTMASPRAWFYEGQSNNHIEAVREVTALISANLESIKALEQAAQVGNDGWTRSKILESKSQLAHHLDTAKAASPFPRYPLVWENPAAWLAANKLDIAAYDQWIIEKSLYKTFLAARQHLKINPTSQTIPNLTNLREHIDEETFKTLDQIDASLFHWKWNFGEKFAIQYTSPDGHRLWWPENPPSGDGF